MGSEEKEYKRNHRTIILSKYFDKNALAIAGVCSRCYFENDDDDVRIIAVNRNFLKQTEERKSLKYFADAVFHHGHGKSLTETAADTLTDNCLPITDIAACNRKISPWFDSNNSHQISSLSTTSPKAPWVPPPSPHNLIEEALYHDPWSLLVATIFLNKTSCKSARSRIEQFLQNYSHPGRVLEAHPVQLEKYFCDLGLHKRRAEQVWKMSYDFLHKDWKKASDLYGIGKYGEDAYRIFILGDLDVEPTDRFLRIYHSWMKLQMKERTKSPDDFNNNQ